MKQLDLAGQRFGKWVAKRRATKPSYWTCVCDCGGVVDVFIGSLRSGRSKGCLTCHSEWMKDSGQARKNATKHGMHGASEYNSWHQMKGRCLDDRNHNFPDYGGRGISIHSGWIDSFETFFKDMGPKPSKKHTLDRIDPDGNYGPNNCRWATPREQNRNKRNSKNIRISIDGEEVLLLDALDTYGNIVSYQTAKSRISRGWPHKKAVTHPPRTYKGRSQ